MSSFGAKRKARVIKIADEDAPSTDSPSSEDAGKYRTARPLRKSKLC